MNTTCGNCGQEYDEVASLKKEHRKLARQAQARLTENCRLRAVLESIHKLVCYNDDDKWTYRQCEVDRLYREVV